jgi:hypothetical protein
MITINMLWQKRKLIVYCPMHECKINTHTFYMHSTYCMSESLIKSKINRKGQSRINCIQMDIPNKKAENYLTTGSL